MISGLSWQLLDLHKLYKTGTMPLSRGLYEHPNSYLEAMTLINTVFAMP